MSKNRDYSVVLAGEAGQGIQTIEHLLTRILKLSGYNVFSSKEYMSRIRGGINSTQIRISWKKVAAFVDRIDILIPLSRGVLEFLKGLKPKRRVAATFGSYGWGGGAVKSIERKLEEAGVEIVQSPLTVRYVPDENESRRCYEYGKDFAKRIEKEK